MKKRVSLKDIANKVGVSTTLVSYVLNNQMENRINRETAEKIRKAAAELHYRPNQIAKSLKSSKTQTIGLIVADIANPFSSGVARIIEDEAAKDEYTVIFGSADENARKAEGLINALLSRQVDGFIIAPPEGFEKQLRWLRQEDVPFVLMDRYFEQLEACSVSINNYAASFNAVNHLIENGYRNIGFINYKTRLIHLQERTRGYREALQAAGLPVVACNLKEIEESKLKVEISAALDGMLQQDNPVDALFFSSSNVSIEGLAFLRERGIVIPDQLGVLCFDETRAYDLFPYPVTYIRQPLKAIGQAAVKLLLETMEKQKKTKQIMLETEMIIRASSKRSLDRRHR